MISQIIMNCFALSISPNCCAYSSLLTCLTTSLQLSVYIHHQIIPPKYLHGIRKAFSRKKVFNYTHFVNVQCIIIRTCHLSDTIAHVFTQLNGVSLI